MSGGRPLRFLAVALGGWTIGRVVLLWPAAVIPSTAMPAAQLAAETMVDPGRWLTTGVERPAIARWPPNRDAPLREGAVIVRPDHPAARVHPVPVPPAAIGLAVTVRHGDAMVAGPVRPDRGAMPPPLRPTPIAAGRARLAGSAWSIVRGGSNGTLLGGQLGASQAGARLTYAVGEAHRVALSARIATPLSGRGREAAFGIDWQPAAIPLHLLAEQRVSLDGQRGGPTLLLVGGINPTPVLAGFRLEGYGQAGAIKRGAVEAFGDGAARLTHRLAIIGSARIDLGGGAWGAAQRGARRLDVGPTIGAVLPVAAKALRVTLDWRERIAGNARPGSGPALSIGADF